MKYSIDQHDTIMTAIVLICTVNKHRYLLGTYLPIECSVTIFISLTKNAGYIYLLGKARDIVRVGFLHTNFNTSLGVYFENSFLSSTLDHKRNFLSKYTNIYFYGLGCSLIVCECSESDTERFCFCNLWLILNWIAIQLLIVLQLIIYCLLFNFIIIFIF